MATPLREDLSLPFAGLAAVLAALVVVDSLWYPTLFQLDRRLTLAYGGLLVGFALAYGYRPLRESAYGCLLVSLFVMLFALVHSAAMGTSGPLMPYGLFGVALAVFCYQLYRLGSDRIERRQAS